MTTLTYKRLTLGLLVFYAVSLAVAFPGYLTSARAQPSISSGHRSTLEDCSASLRGGEEDASSERLISQFLSENDGTSLDDFHVHGWRWHTMSLVREAGRLRNLAQRSSSTIETKAIIQPLKQATDYVIGFNLKGLHKIEADLFFPWMREKLTSVDKQDLSDAFATVMDRLESDRQLVEQLGESIKRSVSIACDESKSPPIRSQAIESIATESATLESYARSMMERENTFLVPAIAQIVPESEQKSFNTRVLMNLGLLDSRLHLVGMHEAVFQSENGKEQELFKQAIPSIPQMMIPRWKRKLYEPKANVLD